MYIEISFFFFLCSLAPENLSITQNKNKTFRGVQIKTKHLNITLYYSNGS